MAIRCKCKCGANIRMPASAAGRKARCRSCGAVFTVPAGTHGPAGKPPPEPSPRGKPAGAEDDPFSWLEELSKSESQAAGERTPAPISFARDDPQPAETARSLPARHDDKEYPSPDRGRDQITGAPQPFWRDLAESFVFFIGPGNVITFAIIAVITALRIPLSFAGVFGMIGQVIIAGYLCAFYLATIVETASGEDDLPNVRISNTFDDLIMPLVRFVGTWACVLLPAIGLVLWSWATGAQVPWQAVRALAVLGLFFWPVVILVTAIGGGFSGLWPHVIIRTALSALLPYLAVCATLLIAAGLLVLPTTDLFQSAANRLVAGATFQLAILNSVLNAYAMIVAMRVIGLFYRHYKHKFPWVAE